MIVSFLRVRRGSGHCSVLLVGADIQTVHSFLGTLRQFGVGTLH